jgi:glycosyltransferase involved in cell wall biosynthesis
MSFQHPPIAVSVIIPAYNAAPWLPMLFDGLDAQSFRNFEVIFINDGSTDETANLLDSYAVERSNVKVIHQPNRGVAIARNTGLDAAVGKYVAFVDADDAIAPTYLEKLVSLADSLDLDIAFCSAWRFIRTPGDMTDANLLIHPKPQGVVPGKEWLERTVADKEWFAVVWASLFRSGFIEDHNFRFAEGALASEDVLWGVALQPRAKRVAFTPETTYYYRNTPGSIVNDNSIKGRIKRIRAHTFVVEEILRMADSEAAPLAEIFMAIAVEGGRRLLGEVSDLPSLKQRIIISSYLRKRGFLSRLLHETKIKSHKKRILTAYFFSLLGIFTSQGYFAQKFRRLTLTAEQRRRCTPQKKLHYFALNIVDHCNLRCKGCDHFAPLADNYCVPLATIESDLHQFSKILKGELLSLAIMGGESLLHPQLKEIMIFARSYFPRTKIRLRTNGILLNRQDDDFWRTCREQNIDVIVTKYPINLDFDNMEKKAALHRVTYGYDNTSREVTKTSYKIPLDIAGKQDPETNFRNCFHANTYPLLMEGRLYTCTVAPNVHHFNKSFGTSLELKDDDFLNIYSVMEASEIYDFLSTPKPFCRYCDVGHRSYGHKWERSKKAMDEWIA